jgi:uncharacterized protein (TIGR02118 family)
MTQRIVFLLRRQEHLSRTEFQRYWIEKHAPLVQRHAATLGIARYQQVHTVEDTRITSVAGYDGVAELWLSSAPDAASRDKRKAAAAELLEDENSFIDLPRSPIWIAEEDELLDGPKDGLRVTAALVRKAGTTRDEFLHHWRTIHGPWALRHPEVWGFTSYTQLRTPPNAEATPLARERNSPLAPDGLSEIYRVGSTAAPEVVAQMRAEILADELNFINVDESPVFTGQVHVII